MNSKSQNENASTILEGRENMMPAKQKKISTVKDANSLPNLIQVFMSEIKQVTGLTHEKIAQALDPKGMCSLDGVAISQYKTGVKTMSSHRLLSLAKRTRELGWEIPCIQMMLFLDEIFTQKLLDEISANHKEINKKLVQNEKKAVASLMKSVSGLVQSGWNVEDLVCMVIFLTQIFDHEEKFTFGGIVDPARITNMIGGDSTNVPEMMWLTWRFMSLNEAAQEFASQSDLKKAGKAKTTTKSKMTPTAKSNSKTAPKSKAAKKSPTKRSSK